MDLFVLKLETILQLVDLIRERWVGTVNLNDMCL